VHKCVGVRDQAPSVELQASCGKVPRLRSIYLPCPWSASARFCAAIMRCSFSLGRRRALDHQVSASPICMAPVKSLPACPAQAPPFGCVAACHPVSSFLCPTLHMRQPSVPTAGAPRLDGWRVAFQADDTRTAFRHTAAAVGVGRDAVAAERVSVLVLVGALAVSELDTVPARRALHCFLWPPSFQCTFWHSAEQYRTCGSRARWRVKFRRVRARNVHAVVHAERGWRRRWWCNVLLSRNENATCT
jgi:hypothetical protein